MTQEEQLRSQIGYEIKSIEKNIDYQKSLDKILDLKVKKSSETEKIDDEFYKKVLALEIKNNELINRINICQCEDPTVWESFKVKFSKELSDISISIQNQNLL